MRNLMSMRKTALVAALASAASSVYAQDLQLEEVIVSAQGREESLEDVPVAVSVLSGETLDNFYVSSLQDVSARIPNVQISSGPADVLTVRGIGSGTNVGFEQSVGIYVDGIYRSRSRAIHAALFDLERVEVLKGPQTTFFGGNSIAGAISITTRAPGDEFGWNVTGLYGEDGEYNLEAGVDLPVSDTFRARVAVRANGMDGYLKTLDGDAPDQDNKQARLSFRWNPTDFWQSDFRFDYVDSESKGQLAFQLVGCPAPNGYTGTACTEFLFNNNFEIDDKLDYNSDTALDYIDLKQKEVAWTNTFDIGDSSKLILKTGYYDHEADSVFTGIPFPHTAAGTPLPPFLGAIPGVSDPFPVGFNEEFEQFSQEIRFQTDTGGFFDYMVGAYYDNRKFDFLNNVNFFFNDFGFITKYLVAPAVRPFLPPPLQALIDESTIAPGEFYAARLTNSVENDTYSAFASVTLRPTESMRINLGGRYTRFEKEAHRFSGRGRTNADGTTYEPLNAADDFTLNLTLGGNPADFDPNKRTDDEFLPTASIQYDLSQDIMGYVSYAEGFKAGGFSSANNPDVYDPEYVDAYEIGLKGRLFDGRMSFSLAAFLNEFEDFQESVVVNDGVTLVSVVKNAGKLESKGVEFEGSFAATENLVLNASIAYLDATYDEFENAACNMEQLIATGGSGPGSSCVQDLSGKTRAYSPEWSGNLSADWTIPLQGYRVMVSPMIYYKDDHYLSAEIDPWITQESYYKIDLRVSLTPEHEHWSLALIGKNLNDEVTSPYGVSVTNADGSARMLVDRPRSYAIQFSMQY